MSFVEHLSFSEEIGTRRIKFEEYLDEYFRTNDFLSLENGSKKLFEATTYSLFQEGKRFRPTLCLIAAEALAVSPKRILPWATAIEMVHTYSLIHDDLPCMDNDDFRRGKPTNHKVFGEDFALLAGDVLLTEAFFILSTAYASEPDTVQKTVRLLAEAAGLRGMVAGQALDIGQKTFTFEELKKTHALKTGALIRVCCEGVAAICGIPSEKIAIFKKFGENLGFAFQVKDDLLDEEKQENSSYLNILGKQGTLDLLKKTTLDAHECLKKLGLQNSLLNQLVEYNLNREK